MANDTHSPKSPAWLQIAGTQQPLNEPQFTIGRAASSTWVIADDLVSRKHARLQYDEAGDYWMLIDLGSTNGTYLNDVRIVVPQILQDGDQIQIGNQVLVFRQPSAHANAELTQTGEQTMIAIRSAPCWLVLLDVKHSTHWIQTLSAEEYSQRMRLWSKECEAIISASQGQINEYLGDGILAFWKDGRIQPLDMAETLRAFVALESQSGLAFRLLCHHGTVNFGAGMSSSREKLAGYELNFVFKLEKVAAATGRKLVCTESAAQALRGRLALRHLGYYTVPGVSGSHRLYGLDDDSAPEDE